MAITATVEATLPMLFSAMPLVTPSVDTIGVMPRRDFTGLTYRAQRIKVIKPQGLFWANLITTGKTVDFDTIHIFHHPSPNQHKKPHLASDASYETFSGGWPEIESVYAHFMAIQHAASTTEAPLLIPYIRMAAFNASSPANDMFAADPVETINAIMAAGLEDPSASIKKQISTSSFSNGIAFQATTMAYLSFFVAFCFDYDSSYIKGKSRDIGPTLTRTIIRYSQKPTTAPSTKNFYIPAERWPKSITSGVKNFNTDQLHHLICWRCHADAMNQVTL